MTTIVTVKTHDWPVSATTATSIDHKSPEIRVDGYQNTETFVPGHTTRDFTLSAGTILHVRELPQDAIGLPGTEDF